MDANQSSANGLQRLPQVFRDFRSYHAGESMLVCGCGSSLSQIVAPERVITIGVNDVGRLFDPDYLVVINPRSQFAAGRFSYVERSRAQAIFTQLDLGLNHPRVIKFQMGGRADTEFNNPDVLPYTRNSPYPAICLAVHMGARRIGVIGVDFTQNHFFGSTGRHPLAHEIDRINEEYKQLDNSCRRKNIEVFNLSSESLLTAFRKMTREEFFRSAETPRPACGRKVFFVNYRFLSCGHVFRDGLAHAADRLGLEWKAALWDKPGLDEEISGFEPDLVFVVHGRKFSSLRRSRIPCRKSAVWLLDEPYEVDDTSKFSALFDSPFVNDPSTLHRHRNARYLPVGYDPDVHFYRAKEERPHTVGFVGGFNPIREQALARLARRDLLSYTVGGPWRDQALLKLCQSANIPAEQTAELYRHTRIVLNVFRKTHHYNSSGILPVSMNPRIYEALQCGALVISEHRPEMDTACPELPTFRSMEEMEYQIERFLGDADLFARVRKACIRRLAGHTYAQRLRSVLEATLDGEIAATDSSPRIAAEAGARQDAGIRGQEMIVEVVPEKRASGIRPSVELPPEVATDWELNGHVVQVQSDHSLELSKMADDGPGTELGLVGKHRQENVILEFEVLLERDSRFLAKIHQVEAHNQLSNSYHLVCSGSRAYLARHNHVLCRLMLPLGSWIPISFSYCDGLVIVRKSGAEVARASDRTLTAGYCFLGVKGGSARVRNLVLQAPVNAESRRASNPHHVFRTHTAVEQPKVSIITTVYDRIGCLEQCLRSVQALEFRNYEHVIVADAPPDRVLEQIKRLIAEYSAGINAPTFASLRQRANDWGISPAALGLRMSTGKYVCFLSDDNGYMPTHFNKLVHALESDANLGFAYSSCLYDGRTTLSLGTPRPGRIDLGQPLFRCELFEKYLGGTIPFREHAWDWRMIEHFVRSGVKWRHINESTFIFRLAKYPNLEVHRRVGQPQ